MTIEAKRLDGATVLAYFATLASHLNCTVGERSVLACRSSHLAIDYTKAGNLRTLALNDRVALTCLGNDYGYEHVFAIRSVLMAGPVIFSQARRVSRARLPSTFMSEVG